MSFLVPKESTQNNAQVATTSLNQLPPIESSTGDFQVAGRKDLQLASSSVINFYPRWCHCFSCLKRTRHEQGEKVPCCKRCRDACSCPSHGIVSRFILFFLISASFWFVMWGLDSHLAEDTISSLIILEILGISVGISFKFCSFPALLAPLIIGIVLNNIPSIHFFDGLHHRGWIEPIREMALTIILTRAGVELSPKQMRKLKGIVPLAAFGPCIVEAMACAIFFYAMFSSEGVDIALCFVAGFSLAAVSPAVVVPGMLSLKRKRYGEQKGVATLLIAASSIDDVLAISAFSIALSFVNTGVAVSGSKWKTYAGVAGIFVGIIHGFVVGILLHFIPSSSDSGHSLPNLRTVTLLLANFSCIFLYRIKSLAWLSGAGSLGVLCTSFFASFGWRSVPHWKKNMKKIEVYLAHIWTLCVPLLFGTIGHEINFVDIAGHLKTLGKVIAIIICALIVRCTFMFLITGFTKFNKKERLFCALSWIPKATVQAALAPLVLNEIEQSENKQLKRHGQIVVTMAVFAILITAPLGAILINLTGPRLLKQAPKDSDELSISKDLQGIKGMVVSGGSSDDKLSVVYIQGDERNEELNGDSLVDIPPPPGDVDHQNST